jgi:hypothetical protein
MPCRIYIVNFCSNQPLNLGIAASGIPKLVSLAIKYLGEGAGALLQGFSNAGALAVPSQALVLVTNNVVSGLDYLACTSQAFSVAATASVQSTPLPLGTFNPVSSSVVTATSFSNADLTSCTSTMTATATAAANYVEKSDNCSTSQGMGNAVYCCSGGCIDGTSIGNPGQCEYWLDLCLDLKGGPPSCSSNEVLIPRPDGNGVDSGDGNCWGGDECQWQRNNCVAIQ